MSKKLQYSLFETTLFKPRLLKRLLTFQSFLIISLLSTNTVAQTLISISNAPSSVNATAVGDSQFWPTAGTVNGVPISLRATVTSLSAGDTISLFTSGDNPVVRTNTTSSSSTVLWEVFDAATGLPISADPNFLITDIDGSNGTPIESVSAACAGLTSYSINGTFVETPVCNANSNAACSTNIRVSESGGNILAQGTQNQNGSQQEGYMQYSWTSVSSWVVNYMATSRGRWFVHDADGDVPFDGATEVIIQLVDMATIKGVTAGSLTSPAQGEQITYEIQMSNIGPEIATGANLTDLLPAGLMYVSHNASSGNYDEITGEWTGVTVAVGGVQTLTITAVVTAAAGETITNETTTALATESICSSRDVLEYTFVVAETPAPSMTIDKSISSATAFNKAGDTITYSYEITNTGNINIDNVAPTDGGPTFGGIAATNSLSVYTPASATITPGSSETFTATYMLDQDDVDNMALDANPLLAIDNITSATGVPVGGVTLPTVANSSAETGFALTPTLSIVKEISAATTFDQAGETITYQYTVTNTGNITIENVSPVDVGPTFNGNAAASVLSVFDPLMTNLAPGDDQIFTATYVLQQADVDNMAAATDPLTAIDNTATATGDPVGATALPAVADSTAETGFAPMPMMTIAKSVGTATSFSQAGDTITYEYLLDNTGNVSILNAVPTDAGPTFNGVAGTNTLSAFTPASATIAPSDTPVLFTATYVISQDDVDNMFISGAPATAIDNIASATGAPIGTALPSVTNSAAETGFALDAELTLVKAAAMPSIGLGSNTTATDGGDTIVYSFEVTNSGDVTIDNLVINDSGPSFNGQAASGVLSAINCPLTTLAPGQMTSCTASYTLSQGDVDNAIAGGADAIDNSATAEGQDPNNASVISASSDAEQTIAADSSIEINKSAGAPTIINGADPALVDPGDTITYQLDVDNTGNTTLTSVEINDTIATVVCPAVTDMGAAFVNDGSSSLQVGDGIVCSATYGLQQSDLDNGGVQNTADVSSLDPLLAAVDDSDVVDSGFTQKTSISLVKSSTTLPATPMDGDPITYSFELTNTGNVTLTSPEIMDPICEVPLATLTFADGYVSGDTGLDGVMDAGEVWIFECEYTIDTDDANAGEVANTATGTGTPPAGSGLLAPQSTASNLVSVQQNAAIALDKSSSLPTVTAGSLANATDIGDTVTYTFEVENTGNVTLINVMLSDPLITGAPNNGTINCPAGINSMAAGDIVTCTASYNLTQDDIDSGMVANTASASGTPPVAATAPVAESSNTVTIAPAPNLSITKSVAALTGPLTVGDTVDYTFLVENTGNVTINDVLPLDSGPTFNGGGGTGAFPIAGLTSVDLTPGMSTSFSVMYTLTQDDIDNLAAASDPLTAIDNSATASGNPENGSLPSIDSSSTETGLAPNPMVTLTKSSTAPVLVEEGQLITYEFLLSNSGNVTIDSPIVTDAKCEMPGSVLNFASGYSGGDLDMDEALDVGETWTFNCTYAITQADINAGTVQNTATGGGQAPDGSTVEDDSDSSNTGDNTGAGDDPTNTPLAQTSSWAVDKSTMSTPSLEGDTLVYQFLVENTGNVDISSVTVVDSKCTATPVLVGGDIGGDLILSPPEEWMFECTSIGVTQAEVDAGTVDNEVDVMGVVPTSAPVLAIAEDAEMTSIAPMPSLSIDKEASAATIGLGSISGATDPGDTISYSFNVVNDGNVTITNVSVNDSGPSFGGFPSVGTWSGVTCPAATLLPMQSTTCSAVYTLAQLDIDRAVAAGVDSVENSATAEGLDPDSLGVTSPAGTDAISISSDPELQILKTAAAPTVAMGSDTVLTDPDDTIDFSITIENTGNVSLSNVLVTDTLITLPNVLTCDATASPSGAAFANDGTASLVVGDSVECTATYTIVQNDINAGQVINTATVEAEDPAGDSVDGIAEAISPFTQKTSIALLKTATEFPAAPSIGDLITYTFLVENTGNVTLSAPIVDDPQCESPVGPLTLLNGFDSSSDGSLDNGLDAGEIWTLSCTYAITNDDITLNQEVTNTAEASGTPPSDSGLEAPTAISSTLVRTESNLAITLDKVAGIPTMNLADPNFTDVGDTVTFTFNITNTSNIELDSVTLIDPLITSAPNNGSFSCTLNDGAVVPTVFDLESDALPAFPFINSITCTADYTLTQADIDAGGVNNTAQVIGNPPMTVPPSPAPEAFSGSTVPITPAPSLDVEKNASTIPTDVMAGDSITYTFDIENTGNVTINNVTPVDLGPTFNGVSGTNFLSVYDPVSATLEPGDMQSYEATYVISQVDLDNMAAAATDSVTAVVNQATADGEPTQGLISPVPPSEVITGVAFVPEIELKKSSTAPAVVTAGANIVYTFMLENTGNVSISNPSINDPRCMAPSSVLTFANGYVSGDTGTQPEVLDVGETWEFSCTYAISQADINTGTVQNTAIAQGQDPSGITAMDNSDSDNAADELGNDDDPTNTPLAQTSLLTVDKSTTTVVSVEGEVLLYQFIVNNDGNVDIDMVDVDDPKCAVAPVLISGDIGNDLILSPPETWVYQCTSIGVTQTEVDDEKVDNQVTVTGEAPPSAPDLSSASDDISTTITSAPSLTIEKNSAPATTGLGNISTATDVGDTIVYSFTVQNTGNVTISAISVTDTGPTFAGNIGTGSWTGVTCMPVSLLPLDSSSCSATYTLSQDDIDAAIAAGPNSVVNSATANGIAANTATVVSLTVEDMTSIEAASDISIIKTSGEPTIIEGNDDTLTDPDDTVSFNLQVENTGNTTLSNVLVSDTLTSVSCPISASPSGNAFVNDGTGSLAVGDSVICTAVYIIDQNDINVGEVVNTANVNSVDPAGTAVNDTDQETTGFTQKTSLALAKTASVLPDPAAVGNTITYTFVLENTGNVTLTNAVIEDAQCEAPTGDLTATNGLDIATDDNNDGLLDAGETWTFMCDYDLVQADINAGEVVNTAMTTANPPVGSGLDVPSSSSSSLAVAQQNISIGLDKIAGLPTLTGGAVSTITDEGDIVNFTFNISNSGNVPFDTVTLTDPLITAAPNSGTFSCVKNDGLSTLFVLDSSPLLVDESATCTASYSLLLGDVNSGSLDNTASVEGNLPVTVLAPAPEAVAATIVPITPAPSMTVMKSASSIVAPAAAGAVITYTYLVENTGNVTINNAVPVDAGPVFNGVNGTNSLSAYDPLNATLEPGDSQSFEATYVISQTDLDNMAAALDPNIAIVNEAGAQGSPVNGSLATVPLSEVETGFEPSPELTLIKSSSISSPVYAGSLIRYSFNMTNTGNVTIRNPIVTDGRCQAPSAVLSFASGYVSGDTGLIAEALDVGETWAFACDYAITQADIDAGTVPNTAIGSGLTPDSSSISDNSDSANAGDDTGSGDDPTNTALPRVPNWSIDKTTSSVPNAAGDTLDYRFVVTNRGNTTISSVTVADAKCVGGVATLDNSSDTNSDNLLSPAGVAGVPAAEQWIYTCTSIAVTQLEMNVGEVINDVTASGTTAGGGLANVTDREVTQVDQNPLISLVKSAGSSAVNADGTFDQSFDFVLTNVGNVSLSDIIMNDDLDSQFGSCFDSIIDPGVSGIIDIAPTDGSAVSVTGASPIIAEASILNVGDSLTLSNFVVRFNPNAGGCSFDDPAMNSATASANSPAGAINDVSDSGTTPSSSSANNSGDPTLFPIPATAPEIGVSKSAVILAFNDDFTFDVEYTIRVQNTGNVDLMNLSLFDDVAGQFGEAFTPSSSSNTLSGVLSGPSLTLETDAGDVDTVLPNLSTDYQGDDANIFDGESGFLGLNDIIQVAFSIRVDPTRIQPLPPQFENTASVSAETPNGTLINDLSNSGEDPSVGPGGSGSPTIVTLDDVANLPIVLGQFSSQRISENKVQLNWKTQTEVANLGFNLYARVNDEWQLLNDSTIPAKGDSVELVSYSFVANSSSEIFALSDIDGQGKETLHGPFMMGINYGKASQRKNTDWERAIQRRQLKSKSRSEIRRKEMILRNQRRQLKRSAKGDA